MPAAPAGLRRCLRRGLAAGPESLEGLDGGQDGRELAMQAGQRDRVDVLRGEVAALVVGAVEGRGRVGEGGEAQVPGHPGRRRDAVVGRQPGDHDGADAPLAQEALEVGADECAVHVLLNDRLTLGRPGFRLEVAAGN
jgi:hypothetical protein